MTLSPGDSAPKSWVTDVDGNSMALETFWQREPVAIFFMRHSGCPFCIAHIHDVARDAPRFREAGAGVVVVTLSSSEDAARMAASHGMGGRVVADPRQEAYRAFAVPRGSLLQLMGPSTWLPGLRALVRGGVGVPRGDMRQLPASFVVDQRGKIRFAHYADNSADRPDHEEMIAVAGRASQAEVG